MYILAKDALVNPEFVSLQPFSHHNYILFVGKPVLGNVIPSLICQSLQIEHIGGSPVRDFLDQGAPLEFGRF